MYQRPFYSAIAFVAVLLLDFGSLLTAIAHLD